MPFLTIAGIEVLVTDLAEQEPTLIGDTGRSFSGAWRGDTSGEIRAWRGTGLEVAASEYHALRSAVRRGTVEVQGGAIYGGWSRRMRVTLAGSYVPSGTAYFIVPGFTMEDAQVIDLAYLLAPDRTAGWTFSRASTATQVSETGLIETVAAGILRDKHYVGGERSILLELARTNGLLFSEAFDNAAWTKSDLTVSADVVAGPDGGSNADKLIAAATTTPHFMLQNTSVVLGTAYTMSVFVKAAEWSFVQIAPSDGFPSTFQNFNLATGAKGNGDAAASGIDALGNGWYRVWVRETATSTISGRFTVLAYNSDVATRVASVAGDGASGVYAWGAQFEASPFPTSYIATGAAAVTRSVDILSRAFPSDISLPRDAWVRHTRWRAQMADNGGLTDPRIWQIGSGAAAGRLNLTLDAAAVRLSHQGSLGSKTVAVATDIEIGDIVDATVRWNGDGTASLIVSVNGATPVSATLDATALSSAWTGGATTFINSRDGGANAGAMALLRDAIRSGVPSGGTAAEWLEYMRGEAA